MDVVWQLQEAKQRFSELIRAVEADGPQVVSRHGREVAVVIDIEEYARLRAEEQPADFKEFLLSGPRFDDVELRRDETPARSVLLD